jgi:hypothetical protein
MDDCCDLFDHLDERISLENGGKRKRIKQMHAMQLFSLIWMQKFVMTLLLLHHTTKVLQEAILAYYTTLTISYPPILNQARIHLGP